MKSDRSSSGFLKQGLPGRTLLRLAVGLTALAVLLTLAFWVIGRNRTARMEPREAEEVTTQRLEDLYATGDKPMTLQMKVVETENGQIKAIPAVIYRSKSRLNQMKQAVLFYLQGPRSGAMRLPGPSGMLLNELYLTADGTAVVDLSLNGSDVSEFGFWEQVLFVRGLLFALNNHFPETKRVRLLMDGQESGTLAGHYALGLPTDSYTKTGSQPLPE